MMSVMSCMHVTTYGSTVTSSLLRTSSSYMMRHPSFQLQRWSTCIHPQGPLVDNEVLVPGKQVHTLAQYKCRYQVCHQILCVFGHYNQRANALTCHIHTCANVPLARHGKHSLLIWQKWMAAGLQIFIQMSLVCHTLHGQCSSVKVMSLLNEIFPEHGAPEQLLSDNGLQHTNALFCSSVSLQLSACLNMGHWKFITPSWSWLRSWSKGGKEDTATCQVQSLRCADDFALLPECTNWHQSPGCTFQHSF